MFESIIGFLILAVIGLIFFMSVKIRRKNLTEFEQNLYETARKETTR